MFPEPEARLNLGQLRIRVEAAEEDKRSISAIARHFVLPGVRGVDGRIDLEERASRRTPETVCVFVLTEETRLARQDHPGFLEHLSDNRVLDPLTWIDATGRHSVAP